MSTPDLAERVLAALREVLPPAEFTPLHEPEFGGNEWRYLKECLDTGWVSSVGKFVDRFEEMLCEITGARRAIAVVNGTAALHVSLLLAGVSRNDEVLIPALTFIATANAVSYCGAIPHFVDADEATLGMDPAKLREYLSRHTEPRGGECFNRSTGRRIKAAVPMHTFGHPVDLDSFSELCDRFGIVLIEDAAESLGSYYKGEHTGCRGRLSALSFNGNKTVTTGGGGAILTNDEELGKLAKHLTTTAKVPHRWAFNHDRIGFNYRLPNLNAALGCAQLERLPDLLVRKRELARRYREAFAGCQGVTFVTEPQFGRSNYWLNALLLDRENSGELESVLDLTNDAGVMTRPAWTLLSSFPMFKESPRMELSVAASLEQRLINIPSSAALGGAP